MSVFNFTTTDTTFTLVHNGINRGTWQKIDEIDNEQLHLVSFYIHDDHFTFSLKDAYYNQIIFSTDTVIHNGVTQGGTIRSKVAYLKDNVFYLPVESGEGGEAGRFGIEDITGVQDRAVDMEGNDLVITNVPYFSVSDDAADGINELIQSGTDGGNYIQASGSEGRNFIEANSVSGQNLISSGSANSLTSFRNLITANGAEAHNDLTSHGVGAYLLITAAESIEAGAVINTENLTTTRNLQFPNKSGVLALVNVADNFADDAAAATGLVPVGGLYHTSGAVKVRLA